MAVDLRQTHFRFGKDDGTESSHTFWQNEDVNHSQEISADWAFLLRFTEQEMGGTVAGNTDAQFQYNKNGAGWVNITTTSSVVKAVAVAAFTNGQNCTKRLSGTGTFETSAAGCTEDGSSGGPSNDIPASGNSETEAGLQIVFADIANNDTIQFRFTSPDWTVTYTITPSLTITVSGPVVVTPSPISAIGGGVAPSVILGSTIALPSFSGAIGQKVDPTVILGSLVIIPAAASAIGSKVDPTIPSGITITPNPISAINGIGAPVVILGSVTALPSFISAIGSGIAPSVQYGSIIIIPSFIDVYGGSSNPTVLIETVIIYISPAGVGSGTATRQFTYQVAGKIHKKYIAV